MTETGLPFAGRHVAVVAAHPDDEIIGFGAQMVSVQRLSLIHLTEGAPSRRTARAHGFRTRQDYARARCGELQAAVALAGVPTDWTQFALPDGLVSLHLAAATERLAAVLAACAPDIVVTHPYEGGHPDHDAAAFITQAALDRAGLGIPRWEMTSYHAGPGGLRTGRFLPGPAPTVIDLPPAARRLKRAMLACFVSQTATLAAFGVEQEQVRPAPRYDFTHAPHAGRLHYEQRRRAFTGAGWRRLAAGTEGAPPTAWLRAAAEAAWLRVWIRR